MALCLPIAAKVGIGAALHNRHLAALLAHSTPTTHVLSAAGTTLRVQEPHQPPKTIDLAGLTIGDEYWQAESNGVIATLMASTHGQVSVDPVGKTTAGDPLDLVALPNGTTLQQILLEDGVAKVDAPQIQELPQSVVTTLKKAQTTAQAQHKNIWHQGNES